MHISEMNERMTLQALHDHLAPLYQYGNVIVL